MNDPIAASDLSALIDHSKGVVLGLQLLVALVALWLSLLLARLTTPLATKLAQLHQDGSLNDSKVDQRLVRIRTRYIALLTHVDNVDTAEFSAGEIETISLPFFTRNITAAAAQSWLRQAPGILISLGLLGTFAGLTAGLSEISGALEKNASTADTISALSAIVAPMGTAFETSLLGLFLSLVVLIWTQVTGTRSCLERCEALLSSWLETVLPLELGNQVITPLRQSIQDLNASTHNLPSAISTAVQTAMGEAFAAKLNQIFDVNATLAAEAQIAVRQLGTVANAFNESGQDFVQAAHAFRDSDFATTLQHAVQSLRDSSEQLTTSSDGLSARLVDVRDGLLSTQNEWQLLAKIAERELETCRRASQEIHNEIKTLQQVGTSLDVGTQATKEAAKQLRETRLEVMRDRKLAIEIAEAVQSRLTIDGSVAESCQVFASALETALTNWNRNVERLDGLTTAFVTSVQQAKMESDEVLAERSQMARLKIEQLGQQLQGDLASAIQRQQAALSQLGEPMLSAKAISQDLLQQLYHLQTRVASISALEPHNDNRAEGGR
ncbi:MAG: hypothetical protein DCF18_10210 [Cyanobium sp.]|nr:MAG: hypothetical protein DCF18_10210 [Cyanobium sp.]